ncbi:MAG: hypothetical protein WAK55_23410, partial [Xanthobacteraceae bacterium]
MKNELDQGHEAQVDRNRKPFSPNQNIPQFSVLTPDGVAIIQHAMLRVRALKPMDKVQEFEFDGAAARQGLIDPFG